ncbi:hypothetical protein DFH09DRAFT_267499 [Mycena vulgaris]|nr:hypothetical protein DFH09DRAFT_267499 [Mycena vulgaris]
MPRLRAPTWIANLRWLYTLLKQIWRGLPAGLRNPIILRLRIGAQKFRALVSPSRSHGERDSVNPGFLSCSEDRGTITHQDAGTPGPPSGEPPQAGFNAAVVHDAPDVEASANNPQDSPPPVSPTSGTAATVVSTSIEGSASVMSKSSPIEEIRAILPERFARYRKRELIARKPGLHDVEAQTLTFATTESCQEGWISLLHPEGARYFSNPERRIFTDVNVCEPQNLANVNQVVSLVMDAIGNDIAPRYAALFEGAAGSPTPDLLFDLVIDLAPNEAKDTTGYYYFINHSERCPFWLETISAHHLAAWDNIEGPIEDEQLRHAMECQYWQHCSMFPSALPLTQPLIHELQEYVVYSIGDISTSLTSTVSRSLEELRAWLSLVKHLEYEGLGSASTFARLMHQFAQERFDNFHGLPHARLNQDQSVYDPPELKPKRSFCFILVAPILFFAPDVYLQLLEKAYVDKTVLLRIWKPLIHKLNTEWQDFTLFATVILNANVAFLSINSVDLPTESRHSPVQIASYLSIVASIGSIILGLLLVRQNRTKFHESAADISASVSRRSSKKFGLELLALIFSLPYALLMWSMIFFFGAFMTTCVRAPDVVTQSIVGVAAGIMTVLVFWCIWDAWDMQEAADHPPSLSQAIRTRLQSIFCPPLSTKRTSRVSKLFHIGEKTIS